MSPDIQSTLRDAARRPGLPLDPDDLRRRGRRRQAMRLAGGTAVALLVGIAGVTALDDRQPTPPPVIAPVPSPDVPGDQPTPDATSPTPTGSPSAGGPVDATTLGRAVATAEDDSSAVIVRHPDGTTSRFELGVDNSGSVAWFPDEGGGLWWQDQGDSPGSAAVHWTGADLTTVTVVEATDGTAERWTLVGPGLATRSNGGDFYTASDDLVQLASDGDHTIVRTGVAGWESAVGEAVVGAGSALWSLGAEGGSYAIHSPATGENAMVYEGGESNGIHVQGVAQTDNGLRAVLVTPGGSFPQFPESRLLLVDSDGAVINELTPPADLGTDVWNEPRVASGGDGHILVNRYAEGTWLPAIVLDLDTLTWSVLDQPGLSRFAARDDARGSTAACASGVGGKDAAPGDGYWLYWSCDDGGDPLALYRAERWAPPDPGPTGGLTVASFVRMHLEALLAGPSTESRRAGWRSSLASGSGVELVAVNERGANGLIVDFTIRDGGTGWRSESAASAMWTRQLASHLFQLEDVDHVELRLNGSCEAYSAWFEGSGCTVLRSTQAAWNTPS